MPKFTKLGFNSITASNRRNILDFIVEEKQINRSVIAKKVGLSIPSVMSITDDLIEKGIIYAVGKGERGSGTWVMPHGRSNAICEFPFPSIGIGVANGRDNGWKYGPGPPCTAGLW